MARIYKLPAQTLVIKGSADKLIKGLSSNSLDKPHNAFLNQHGRIIATCDQLKINDDEVIIVVPAIVKPALLEHLSRYARLNGSVIEDAPLKVYFDLDGNAPLKEGDRIIPQKAGRLILSAGNMAANVVDEAFIMFRLQHAIPLMGIDYQADEMILNVHEYNFVSYTKGCFLGQEPVAKVHNRAKPTWRLTVRFLDDCSAEEQAKMTSKVTDPASGRMQGFVFVKNI